MCALQIDVHREIAAFLFPVFGVTRLSPGIVQKEDEGGPKIARWDALATINPAFDGGRHFDSSPC